MNVTATLDLQWQEARLTTVARTLTPAVAERKWFKRNGAPTPQPEMPQDLLAAFVFALVAEACTVTAEDVAAMIEQCYPGEYRLAVQGLADALLWFDGPQFETALMMVGGPLGLLALLDMLAARGGILPPLATGIIVAGASRLRRRVGDAALIVQHAAAHVGFPLTSGPPPPHGAYARQNAGGGPGRVRSEDGWA